jgi:hypothetical protein
MEDGDHRSRTKGDQKISADFKAGKFNKLIEKARAEFAQGKAREL